MHKNVNSIHSTGISVSLWTSVTQPGELAVHLTSAADDLEFPYQVDGLLPLFGLDLEREINMRAALDH